jgi:hypothetical protein
MFPAVSCGIDVMRAWVYVQSHKLFITNPYTYTKPGAKRWELTLVVDKGLDQIELTSFPLQVK